MNPCPHCGEPIVAGDRVQHLAGAGNNLIHAECLFRMLLGGVNHQARRCRCYGGSEPPDPPEMTRREAAIAAEAYSNKGCL
jgi:hypothetical protein